MIAYFDCFSGISGDMTLGALIDAGVPLSRLRRELAGLPVSGYTLTSKTVQKAGMRATKADVVIKGASVSGLPGSARKGRGARKWKDIERIIRASSLSKDIKQKGLSIFRRLFEAEASVHGGRYDSIHLHELGALDCIIDIFGSLIGLDILGIDTVCSSALNLGTGMIASEHGRMPVPSPAAAELLKGIPVYASDVKFELTTPTGAALISHLSSGFGPMPPMNIRRTGTGAGSRDFEGHPNVMRLFIGEKTGEEKGAGSGEQRAAESVTVIETNIDDMNPQVYEYVMDRLNRAGALDVFLTQGIMKKGRPAIKMTVLCNEERVDLLSHIIFRETTSIGLRLYRAERKTLQREVVQVKTKYGRVRVKESRLAGAIMSVTPEYEDCRKIAKKLNVPLLDVIKTVIIQRTAGGNKKSGA